MPWFTFQLDHLIRPFQPIFIDERITKPIMINGKSKNLGNHLQKSYYINNGEIYTDKIAPLAYLTINSNSYTIERLKRNFDYIFIDEYQDLAGSDLDIIKLLAQNGMKIDMVCDPRQRTLRTHYERKNQNINPIEYIKSYCKGLFEIDSNSLSGSHRCPQNSIKYASTIFPEYPQSNSLKGYESGDGIVFVMESEVDNFLMNNKEVIQLRCSKKTNVNDKYPVTTYKKSKGSTIENALVYPTGEIKKAILSNDFTKLADQSKCDLYISLTRAKHKTGIVIPDKEMNKFLPIMDLINSHINDEL